MAASKPTSIYLKFEQYVGFKPTPSDWKSEMLITNTSTALTKPKCLICQGHLGIPLSPQLDSNQRALTSLDYKSSAINHYAMGA